MTVRMPKILIEWRDGLRKTSSGELSTGPDFYLYKPFSTIISNARITEYYKSKSAPCPTLSSLPPPLIDLVIKSQISREWVTRRNFLLSSFVIISADVVISHLQSTRYAGYATLFITLMVIFSIFSISKASQRGHWREVAVRQLFHAIWAMEKNAHFWETVDLRNHMLQELGAIAKSVERVPLQFVGLSFEIRREILKQSRRKAQAIRNLQYWVLMPGPLTFTDLIDILSKDLQLIAAGHWYELPEANYEHRRSRWLLAGQIAGAIILIAAALAVVSLSARFGSLATITATLLIAVASAIFSRIGLPLDMIQGATDTGSKLIGK